MSPGALLQARTNEDTSVFAAMYVLSFFQFTRFLCSFAGTSPVQEVEDTWQRLRMECGVPGARVRVESVDVRSMLRQQAYVDKYQEGEWVPLRLYLVEEMNVPPHLVETQQKQMEFCQNAPWHEIHFG